MHTLSLGACRKAGENTAMDWSLGLGVAYADRDHAGTAAGAA